MVAYVTKGVAMDDLYPENGVSGYQSLHWALNKFINADYALKSAPEWGDDIADRYYELAEAAVYLHDLIEDLLSDRITE